MTEQFQRAKWPDDTAERITRLRAEGATWEAIACSFGCCLAAVRSKAVKLGLLEPKPNRRFTAEDDAFIRAECAKLTPVRLIADVLGRSRGTVQQRIFHRLTDLKNTRPAAGVKAVGRYGSKAIGFSVDTQEGRDALRQAMAEARTAAKVSAHAAKLARQRAAIKDMHDKIAAGEDRNEAIFECRAAGVSLERLGEEFNITRERIRQICNQVAFNRSLASQAEAAQ